MIESLTNWLDRDAEKLILDAASPLRLSSRSIERSNSQEFSGQYLMRVLDSRGTLTELLWDNNGWEDHNIFTVTRNSLPAGITINFTNIASTDDNVLYAVSDGKIMEFVSDGPWWEIGQTTTSWSFTDYI